MIKNPYNGNKKYILSKGTFKCYNNYIISRWEVLFLDWSIVEQYLPLYQKAFFLTLHIAVWGILGSFLLGLIVSIIRHYRIPVLAKIATAYIELSRNTPLLIQLFFLYFGLPRIGIVLSSEVCATLGLVFLGGSYMAESFRSGLEAVSQTQQEIGLAIGLTPVQVFRYVVIPQATAVALPSFSANVIFLIKETSIFSAVALADLMYVAKDLIGLYYETDIALAMLVVAYLIMLLPVSLVFSWIERRLRHAGFGNPSTLPGK